MGKVEVCLSLRQRGTVIKLKKNDGVEEMEISMNSNSAKAIEELGDKIDEFIKNHSITLVSKDIEAKENAIICRLYYKI